MNRGIFSFPRSGALDARSVKAQTLAATTSVKTPGSSATDTGIKLVDESDLGALFRPASYTAVTSAQIVGSGDGVNGSGPIIGASVSGSMLTLTRNTNCNCACSTDSG
jgi:hypothetical protein